MKGFFDVPADLSRARILVTNDDGYLSTGIKLLEKVARSLSRDVWVVAPESEQSAVSHSLTIRRPLRIRKLKGNRYCVDGTPTDAVMLAVARFSRIAARRSASPESTAAAIWVRTSAIRARSPRPWRRRCWACRPSRSRRF